jgi:hypothetical protein
MTVDVSRTPRSARAALLTGSYREHLVDVCAQGGGIDRRKSAPPGKQRLGSERRTRHRAKLGDRFARARDRDRLAARGAVHDVAGAVAQLADADLGYWPQCLRCDAAISRVRLAVAAGCRATPPVASRVDG